MFGNFFRDSLIIKKITQFSINLQITKLKAFKISSVLVSSNFDCIEICIIKISSLLDISRNSNAFSESLNLAHF
jgi:hypothetical protein